MSEELQQSDFTVTPDSTTSEPADAFSEKLSALEERMMSRLEQTLNRTVSGLAKRLTSDDIPKAIASQFDGFKSSIPSFDPDTQRELLRSELNSIVEAWAAESDDEEVTGRTQPLGDAPEMVAMKKQLESMRELVESAKKAADEERLARQQSEEQQRVSSIENSVLERLRPHVIPNTEKQLLGILKSEGVIVEQDGNYKVKGHDEFGLEALLDIDKALPDLLQNQFSHFKPSRGGTGTGASQGLGGAPAPNRFVDPNAPKLSDKEVLAAMSDPNKMAQLLAEVEGAMRR